MSHDCIQLLFVLQEALRSSINHLSDSVITTARLALVLHLEYLFAFFEEGSLVHVAAFEVVGEIFLHAPHFSNAPLQRCDISPLQVIEMICIFSEATFNYLGCWLVKRIIVLVRHLAD